MNSSPSIAKLAGALSAAQAVVQVAVKDSVNPAFRSKYADLGAVWDACREALKQNHLAVLQFPITPTSGEPGDIGLETIVLHESGEFISERFFLPVVKKDPQGIGSAISYARRYSLMSVLGIVADDDDGAHASGQGPANLRKSTPPAPSRTQQAAPTENAEKASGVVIALNRELQDRYEFKPNEREEKLQFIRWAAKLPSLASSKDLTDEQAEGLLKRLKAAEPAEVLDRWAEYESARLQAS